MLMLKPGLIYFVLVFGTGFVLGTIRVLLVSPQIGDQTAQICEMPIMLMTIVMATRWKNRSSTYGLVPSSRIIVEVIAFGMMLTADIAVGMMLRGQSPMRSLLFRGPIVGAAYYMALGAFALMPQLLGYRKGGAE